MLGFAAVLGTPEQFHLLVPRATDGVAGYKSHMAPESLRNFQPRGFLGVLVASLRLALCLDSSEVKITLHFLLFCCKPSTPPQAVTGTRVPHCILPRCDLA